MDWDNQHLNTPYNTVKIIFGILKLIGLGLGNLCQKCVNVKVFKSVDIDNNDECQLIISFLVITMVIVSINM